MDLGLFVGLVLVWRAVIRCGLRVVERWVRGGESSSWDP